MPKRLLLAFTLLGTAAHAQVRFSAGPQLGYTLATTTYQLFAVADYDTHYRSGFSGGLTAELGLGHLVVRPAVLYTQKGYNQEEVRSGASLTTTSRMRTDYLTLPLQVGYTQHADGQGFQVFAGPYVGLILGGHYTRDVVYGAGSSGGAQQQTYSGGVVAEGTSIGTANYPIRHWDAGFQAGIGYRQQQWLAQLDYSRGLLNADSDRAWASSFYGSTAYHNCVFQFSLAYLFGVKS
ncbi:MAG: porin family protein [Janthinobacterium lividum]